MKSLIYNLHPKTYSCTENGFEEPIVHTHIRSNINRLTLQPDSEEYFTRRNLCIWYLVPIRFCMGTKGLKEPGFFLLDLVPIRFCMGTKGLTIC